MSTQTVNYKFIKPELTDPADINVLNTNWDAVDEALKELDTDLGNSTKVLQEKIGTLQTQITYGTSAPSGGNNGDVYIQLITE